MVINYDYCQTLLRPVILSSLSIVGFLSFFVGDVIPPLEPRSGGNRSTLVLFLLFMSILALRPAISPSLRASSSRLAASREYTDVAEFYIQ